jgi:hypothetical protein
LLSPSASSLNLGEMLGGIFHFSNDGTNECRREEQWRFFRLRQSFRLLHEGARYSFEQAPPPEMKFK